MTYYIFSTLSNDQTYAEYHPIEEGQTISVIKNSINITGKANIATKQLVTPRGMMTKISDDQFAVLKEIHAFKEHVKHGFIHVEKKAIDIDKVVVNMRKKDQSAPIVPEDYDNASEQQAVPEGKRKKRASN